MDKIGLKDAFPDMRNEENNRRVAEHLRIIRKARGVTLEMLSGQTGLSVSYISRLEAGTRRVNLDILTSVSRALQCEISDIIYGNTTHIASFRDLGRQYSASVTGQEVQGPVAPLYESRKGGKKKHTPLESLKFPLYDKTHKDLPLYGVKIASPGQKTQEGVFEFDKGRELISRNPELMGVADAFAILIPDHRFMPRYSSGDILMINPSKLPSYKTPVILIMNDDKVLSGLFQEWVENGASIFVFKGEDLVPKIVLSEDMKSVYSIVSVKYA